MSSRLLLLCCLFLFSFFIGCSKKEETPKLESQAPELTLPQIPKITITYKPKNKDIQIALQNAGFYKGEIDGDIGPLTKEAIRQFQVANNLTVDGKIGPKTWSVLKKYLQ